MCGSWELMGLWDPDRAVSCGVCNICWSSSQLTFYLPLGLRRATAGCTGTPSRHHVTRDVRCCIIGAHADGSHTQAMFETLKHVFVCEGAWGHLLGGARWRDPALLFHHRTDGREMLWLSVAHGKFEVLLWRCAAVVCAVASWGW